MGTHEAAADLSHLDPTIQKVEFKLTVLPAEERRVQALLNDEGVLPVRRQVYFYDTADLALYGRDLVLRARVTQRDDDDSTVKLRPVDLADADAGWRSIDGIRIELDVVGDTQVPSAKLDGEPQRGEIDRVKARRRPVAALFSEEQEQLIADHAPRGLSLQKLEVLGPVDARKWDLDHPDGFPHTLSVEEWSLPDATHFLELSFKVPAGDALDARIAFSALLSELGLDAAGDQVPKTPRVLRYFADRLHERD